MKQKTLATALICIVAALTLVAAAALVFAASFCPRIAFADEEFLFYVKASVGDLEDNEFAGAGTIAVYEKDGEREFLIPESYYIKVMTKVGPSYYKINYFGQEFYIPVNASLVPSADPIAADEAYYPQVVLTLAEGVDLSSLEGVDDNLKKLNSTYAVNFLGYAASPDSPDVIYVMATPSDGGKTLFGFIPTSAFEAFNVPYQQRAQAERDALLAQKEQLDPAPDPGSLPAPSGSVALKVILILGISLPAVIIVILLFVPSRKGEHIRKSRGASSDGKDYDVPSAPYDRTPDRRQYDADRRYDPRSYYPPQNGGYSQTPSQNGGYSSQNGGYSQPPTPSYPPQAPPAPPQGYQGGYDPRMDRDVQPHDDPNNYN